MSRKFFDTRDREEEGCALLASVRALADFVEDEGLSEDFAKYLSDHAHEHGARVDRGVLQVSDDDDNRNR